MKTKITDLNDEFEEKIKQITDELNQANIKLERLSKANQEFLSNMSHELRTPLNSIIGFTEVMQDEVYGALNDKQKEYLLFIGKSANHLLLLINDIIDLSKVESGKMKLDISNFSIANVIQSSLFMVKEIAFKHEIKLIVDIKFDKGLIIYADEKKIKQILFNLLSNAVKFTQDQGIITITAEEKTIKKEDEKYYNLIEISVKDTGIGIKEENFTKIFKKFGQIEGLYEKKYDGTGLGLALTKSLVEFHGGKITIESKFGKGSKFTFTIPIKQIDSGYRL